MMSVTASEAFAAIRSRLDSAGFSFPLYYHGDELVILPDTPTTFAFAVFNNEGSGRGPVAFGGGVGSNLYRSNARLEAYVFAPSGVGLAVAMDAAETIATTLRSFRNDSISCFSADVIPVGSGSTIDVPALDSEVSNYQCAVAEVFLQFDQIG